MRYYADWRCRKVLFYIVLFGVLILQFSIHAQEQNIPLPNVNERNFDKFFEVYETELKKQWIEFRPVFPNDPISAMIIHCDGSIGVVGSWKAHTVCWLDTSEVEIGYMCLRIQSSWYYGYDSGAGETQTAYWGIDLNQDQVDDLVALMWSSGEQGEFIQNTKGEEEYVHVPYDRPDGVRIVQRNSCGLAPCGIASDKFIEWAKVIETPDIYDPILSKVLNVCQDDVWKNRLRKALQELEHREK